MKRSDIVIPVIPVMEGDTVESLCAYAKKLPVETDERNYIVYKYVHKETKGLYIGRSSETMEARAGKNGKGYKGCGRFWRAICREGIGAFERTVIASGLSYVQSAALEAALIKFYKAKDPMYGYNTRNGGGDDNGRIQVTLYDAHTGLRYKTFDSIMDASRDTGINPGQIFGSMKGLQKRAGKYIVREKNVHCLTQEEVDEAVVNYEKVIPLLTPKEAKSDRNHHGEIVSAYDPKTGKRLATYESLEMAAAATGVRVENIKHAVDQERKRAQRTAGNKMWAYGDKEQLTEEEMNARQRRTTMHTNGNVGVVRFDKETGERIGSYPTITSAAQDANTSQECIRRCLNGIASTAGESIWMHEKDAKGLDRAPEELLRKAQGAKDAMRRGRPPKAVVSRDKMGNITGIYKSLTEAALAVGLPPMSISNISRAIRVGNTCMEQYWSYLDEEETERTRKGFNTRIVCPSILCSSPVEK